MIVDTIASETVSLLLPYLGKAGKTLGNKIGKDSLDIVSTKTKELYDVIKKKFSGDTYNKDTFERLEEKPEDKSRQEIMESILKDVLKEDQQFQDNVSQLLNEIKQDGGKRTEVKDSSAIALNGGKVVIKGGTANHGGTVGDTAGGNIIKKNIIEK
jgi:hypothetical protein